MIKWIATYTSPLMGHLSVKDMVGTMARRIKSLIEWQMETLFRFSKDDINDDDEEDRVDRCEDDGVFVGESEDSITHGT